MIVKVLFFVCLALVSNAAVHKLKVNTLAGKSLKALKEGQLGEFKKHHKNAVNFRVHKSSRASRLTNSRPIHDYGDYTYTVNVTVGTPPQPFELYLNTYDDSIWVPDVSCSEDVCGCTMQFDPCYIKNKFDSRKSSTFKTNLSSFKDSNTWGTGILARDTVGIAPNLQVQGVDFGLLDNPISDLYTTPYDGYLSLSFKSQNGGETIIEQAFEQGLIDAPILTLFLASYGWNSNKRHGGQLTIGEVDTDNCSPDVVYVPVYDQEDWTFDMFKTEISHKTKAGSWKGNIGSESTTILIPPEAFDDVSSTTNAKFDPNNGLYSVDCNVKFEWTITLANQNKFTINEQRSVAQINKKCYILFEPLNPNTYYDFFLGAPFIHNYCQVFDMTGKIGFSKVINI